MVSWGRPKQLGGWYRHRVFYPKTRQLPICPIVFQPFSFLGFSSLPRWSRRGGRRPTISDLGFACLIAQVEDRDFVFFVLRWRFNLATCWFVSPYNCWMGSLLCVRWISMMKSVTLITRYWSSTLVLLTFHQAWTRKMTRKNYCSLMLLKLQNEYL